MPRFNHTVVALILLALSFQLFSCRKDKDPIDRACRVDITYISKDTSQILYSRFTHGDFIRATFSFEFATRDDEVITSNDWDLQYGNGPNDLLYVNMVGGDNSRIADLGPVDFASVTGIPFTANYTDEVVADTNHVYIVHTRNNSQNFYAKFVITAMKTRDYIIFDWVRSDDDESFEE